ncbi:MAG: hypothetical protein R2932_17750 [Caldilineaceae bacterium]
MNKVWVIAQREYLVNVRRAGFIIFTIAMLSIGLFNIAGWRLLQRFNWRLF